MTTSTPQRQGRTSLRVAAAAFAILLLSLLYLSQVTIVRGPQGWHRSLELFLRAVTEWGAWFALAPFILRFADAFPVGPGRPTRNLAVVSAGGLLAVPLWSLLVAAPLSGFGIILWGFRKPEGFFETAGAALVQRGPYLLIIYGLIAGLATTRRLTLERQEAATRTVALRRELAAANLAELSHVVGPERLVDRLQEIEQATARSADEAETKTLVLAEELHEALVQSRALMRP